MKMIDTPVSYHSYLPLILKCIWWLLCLHNSFIIFMKSCFLKDEVINQHFWSLNTLRQLVCWWLYESFSLSLVYFIIDVVAYVHTQTDVHGLLLSEI